MPTEKIYKAKFCRKNVHQSVFGRFKSNERGATAVEFGLVAFPFFFLLSAIIEASLFFFSGQMLESAVDRVGRQVRTGQLDASTTQSQIKAAVCSEASILFKCSGLLVDVSTAASFAGLGSPPGPSGGALNPGDFGFSSLGSAKIMRITVTYEWPVFSNYVASHLADLSSGNALLTAISIFKTEPY